MASTRAQALSGPAGHTVTDTGQDAIGLLDPLCFQYVVHTDHNGFESTIFIRKLGIVILPYTPPRCCKVPRHLVSSPLLRLSIRCTLLWKVETSLVQQLLEEVVQVLMTIQKLLLVPEFHSSDRTWTKSLTSVVS